MTPRIIYLIKRAEIEITARMGTALEEFGLTPIQFSVLYFIDITKGDLRLLNYLGVFCNAPINERTGTGITGKTAAKKKCGRGTPPYSRISLTPKGKQLLEQCSSALDNMEDNLLKELSSAEMGMLRNLIGKILETARSSLTR